MGFLRMAVEMKGSARVCEDSTGPGDRLGVGVKETKASRISMGSYGFWLI